MMPSEGYLNARPRDSQGSTRRQQDQYPRGLRSTVLDKEVRRDGRPASSGRRQSRRFGSRGGERAEATVDRRRRGALIFAGFKAIRRNEFGELREFNSACYV